jgi:hypothetical protein
MGPSDILFIDFPCWESLERLFKYNAALQSSQRCTQTKMDPETKRQVVADLPLDIHSVRVVESTLISSRRAGQESAN